MSRIEKLFIYQKHKQHKFNFFFFVRMSNAEEIREIKILERDGTDREKNKKVISIKIPHRQ